MKDKLIASLLALTLLIGTSLTAIPPVSTRAGSEIEFETAVAEVSDVSVVSSADPNIIYVWAGNPDPGNGSKENPYQNITLGLGNATTGDTIHVYNGTYRENLVINKCNLTLIGENRRNTIIDGTGTGTVVYVTKDNVTISNFTIQNSGQEILDSGICLDSSGNSINNSIIINSWFGILLSGSDRNDLTDNIVRNNTYGIRLSQSSYNVFQGNIMRNNTCGICLRDSSDNSIYHNSFIDNTNHIDVLRSKNAWNATWPSGGNHWSNYTGVDEKSGPNQDQPGSDGIGDTPHNITAEERDYYPRLLTVHNVDTGLDYCWIQKAIDADETIDGHTIKVDVSICYENVKVYKSLMLQGENRTTTIIDGGGAGTVLYISASNVSISNFTIRNGRYGIHLDGSGDTVLRNNNMTNNKYNFFVDGTELSHFINDVDGSNWVDGKRIYYLINNQSLVIDISTHPDLGYLGLVNCKNITAQNLNLTGNGQGLLLAFTNGSTITHVNASNNDYGIYLFGCSGDTITGSNIVNNDGDGVNLFGSSENTIASNKIANNHWGVSLEDSNSTNVADNHITESYSGIHASGSGNNVTGNNVTRMLFCGIQLSGSNNSVTNNNVTNNRDGILLIFSLGNNVTCNNITSNSNFGIWLESSSGNTISGNDVINNSYGIYLSLSPGNRIFHNYFFNIIKDTLMAEPGQMNYWHDGYPSGGNYWHFFAPSAEDEKRGAKGFAGVPQPSPGSDGINDTSYYIDSLNVDWYPLMKPYGGLHDIGIRSINLSKTCYIANYSLAINITVINYAGGFYNETINIIVQARNATDHTIPIGSTTFNLTYRNSRIINFTWNTADQKNGTYTIEAILTRVPGETCFEDNTKQTSYVVSIRGDINGDRKVDGKDVALTIKHYGSYPGHPKYNPNVDINCDGKIDGKDVALTIKHYGQHW